MSFKTATLKHDELTIDAPLGAIKVFILLQQVAPSLRIECTNAGMKYMVRVGELFLDEQTIRELNPEIKQTG